MADATDTLPPIWHAPLSTALTAWRAVVQGVTPAVQPATPRDDTPGVACRGLRCVKSGRPEEGRDSVCRLIF